jgi:hypothetical protein
MIELQGRSPFNKSIAKKTPNTARQNKPKNQLKTI